MAMKTKRETKEGNDSDRDSLKANFSLLTSTKLKPKKEKLNTGSE